MTNHSVTLPGYLTGRVDTLTGCENSFAFDLRNVRLPDDVAMTVEVLIDQPRRASCTTVNLYGDDTAYGSSRRAAGRAPFRVRLNDSAIRDLRKATGAFFFVNAVVFDTCGSPQPLGRSRHAAVLTATQQQRPALQAVNGAA